LVLGVDAGSYTPRYPRIFLIQATADPAKREAAIAAIREEVKQLAAQPVTEEELRKAIKMSTSSHLERLKTMQGQASDIAQNEFLVGDPNFSDVYLENLRKVTRDDLQRVIQTYFTDNNLTITTLNPPGTLPTATTTTATKAEIAIKKFDLPNGIRLLVREDPKLPLVDFHAILKGGVIAETGENNGLTKLTARMLLKGTKTRTAEQIAETMESVGGGISHFSGNNSFGVAAQSLSEDFDRTLDLLADVLQNPTFPDDMLTRERAVQLSEFKAEQDQILRKGQQVLREAIFTKHPYRLNLGTRTRSRNLPRRSRGISAPFCRRIISYSRFGNVNADEVRRKVEAKFAPCIDEARVPANGRKRCGPTRAKCRTFLLSRPSSHWF
jgi:zinc protease